jgi:hypothetical protein
MYLESDISNSVLKTEHKFRNTTHNAIFNKIWWNVDHIHETQIIFMTEDICSNIIVLIRRQSIVLCELNDLGVHNQAHDSLESFPEEK